MWCTASSGAVPVQHRPDRPSLSGSARLRPALFPAPRRHDRCEQPGPHHASRCSRTKSTTSRRRATSRCPSRSRSTTADADALGALRLLEAIRILGLKDKTRFYQASTSELYGLVRETPQSEKTPFHPRSPYGVAKLYLVLDHRELPRGPTGFSRATASFSTTNPRFAAKLSFAQDHPRAERHKHWDCRIALYLGNLEARRDWGHAARYVEAQWLMLQRPSPRIS